MFEPSLVYQCVSFRVNLRHQMKYPNRIKSWQLLLLHRLCWSKSDMSDVSAFPNMLIKRERPKVHKAICFCQTAPLHKKEIYFCSFSASSFSILFNDLSALFSYHLPFLIYLFNFLFVSFEGCFRKVAIHITTETLFI